MEHQLDDAVVLERRQRNHFTGCSDDNPESGVMKEVHRQHEGGLASSLDTRCSTVDNLLKVSFLSSLMS